MFLLHLKFKKKVTCLKARITTRNRRFSHATSCGSQLFVVEFEENEEEDEESDLDMVQEEEEDDDDVVEAKGAGAMQMGGGIDDEDDMAEANESMSLNALSIGAY
ncbi:hypothetical protein CJ030_MR2G012404 [Morella rubra]|uniref:Uncharacterized protein n=1 Tax=Morella rubra TaxID=262757 RepID=A0A6A1WHS6_9ROSI|nr:hypothetical protein CJ030_MR2G012404 [Morella rubra]